MNFNNTNTSVLNSQKIKHVSTLMKLGSDHTILFNSIHQIKRKNITCNSLSIFCQNSQMSFNFLMQTDCEVFDFHCTFCRKLQSYRFNHRSFPFMCILQIWCFLFNIYWLFGFSKTLQQLEGPYIHTQVNVIADHY